MLANSDVMMDALKAAWSLWGPCAAILATIWPTITLIKCSHDAPVAKAPSGCEDNEHDMPSAPASQIPSEEPDPDKIPTTWGQLSLVHTIAWRSNVFTTWQRATSKPKRNGVYQICWPSRLILCQYARFHNGRWLEPQATPAQAFRATRSNSHHDFKWRSIKQTANSQMKTKWLSR